MTPRERIMTALRGGQPDRVPATPDISVMIPARLTYYYAPACLADGEMAYNVWYTVYDRSGRIVLETPDEDAANRAAARFDEIVEAELEAAR